MGGDRRDSHAPGPVGAAYALSVEHLRHAPSRRGDERVAVRWAVDCRSDDTFLYAYVTNVSSLGLFVRTEQPLAVGSRMVLCFAPAGERPFELDGEVAWINPPREDGDDLNPGMGVRFVDLCPDDRERLVEVIRTIAYVRDT